MNRPALCPDVWVILKITPSDDASIYKVLAGWHGGLTEPDTWRLNSGIVSVEETSNELLFRGHSGSIYACNKATYCTSSLMQSVYESWVEKAPEIEEWVEMLDRQTALSLQWLESGVARLN